MMIVGSWGAKKSETFKTVVGWGVYFHPMAHLSTQVKTLREAKQRTQQELAAESGVSVTTISRYENERVTMFSAKVLQRLAAALDVHPGLLLVQVE
jgi:DNA-binding XRE family transcriptional regulator